MAKKPEPWYWAARKGWYVQINGKQKKLAADASPKKGKAGLVVPEAATRAYHRLMAIAGRDERSDRAEATIAEVAEVFLGTRSKASPRRIEAYARLLRVLCEPYMNRKMSSLRPADVEQALAGKATWGANTSRDYVCLVCSMCQWAKDAGYTEANAMAGYVNPFSRVTRTRVMTDDEFRTLVDLARDVEFKQIVTFIRGTGCRPGEARKLTATHVHPEKPLVTLQWQEHKTGFRSRKPRFLYMPRDVEMMVRALMERHPAGPLFRNSRNGGGWGEWSLSKRFDRYRRKLGWGDDVVPYTMRHTALTRLLDDGVSVQHVAAIAGHVGVQTLMSTYYHPDQGMLLEAVDRTHTKRRSKPQ